MGHEVLKGQAHKILCAYCVSFGDKDLQLELANPLHLRAILEDPLFAKSRLVLLNGSYPFMREASYLASVYSQVNSFHVLMRNLNPLKHFLLWWHL